MRNLLIIIFALLAFQTIAQETYTLEQALDYAYKNNQELAKAHIDEQLIEAQKQEILGIGLPQIDATADFKDFLQIPVSLLPGDFVGGDPDDLIPIQFGTQYNMDLGITASQIIFSGDYIVALQSSGEFLELTKKSTTRTKISIAEDVSKAFYNVLINEDRLKLIDANINQLESLLSNTEGLYNEGFIEKIDVDRIRVSYNNTVSEKGKMLKFLELIKNILKFQMGYDQNLEISVTGNLELFNFEITEDGLNTYENRIEWSLLESQRTIADLAVKKDKFASLPSLIAYGSYTVQAQRNEFNFTETSQPWYRIGLVGAKLSIPIFSGFQKKYKLEQSNLEVIKLTYDAEILKEGIELEINSAKLKLENGLTTIKIQEENMILAESIYTVVVKKYEEGVGSNIEVIEAETALKTAQNNYYNALYEAIVANIELKKAKGILIK